MVCHIRCLDLSWSFVLTSTICSSGDTGVSAYLVMQGKPPFQVFYKQKRNDEAEKEMSRLFQGSRGDITLQPENSGRYSYSFTHLSDANYKKIKLDGPSISQIVHPLASAGFVFHGATGTGNRRAINSCSGNTVDVEVDLRVRLLCHHNFFSSLDASTGR